MVGLSTIFSRLFGRGGGRVAADGGIYFKVQCGACGEIITGRVNPTAELSLDEDGATYFVRKVVVGRQCFRSVEVLLRYADLRGTELSREVHGGTSVS